MGVSTISIVDADPDLAEQLDDEQLERARHQALTRVQTLSPGEWDANSDPHEWAGFLHCSAPG